MLETSRERVLKTFRHEQPVKLATDFASSTSTGVSIFSYAKLLSHVKAGPGELPRIFDLFLMLAEPSLEMLDLMGSDVVQLKRYAPHFDIPLVGWKPWTLNDGTQCLVPGSFNPVINERGGLDIRDENGRSIARMPKGGFYFDRIYYPYANIEEVEEIDAVEMHGMSDAEVAYLARESRRLHEETDKAVMFPIYARTFEAGMLSFGFEPWLIRLMCNEDMVHRYLERLTDIHISDLDRVLSSSNEYIDFIRFCDDLSTQDSLMMSKEVFRTMIKPYLKKMFSFVKNKYPKQKIALHSCGALRPLIPDLIEIGVDILNPVQISAAGMVPAELKKEFGKDIVFWGGGCDMQNVLMSATIPELKDHVRGLIETFAPGGGFLFAPTHNFQADVPPERITAIYDVVREYR